LPAVGEAILEVNASRDLRVTGEEDRINKAYTIVMRQPIHESDASRSAP
jgi:hypothetical protein